MELIKALQLVYDAIDPLTHAGQYAQVVPIYHIYNGNRVRIILDGKGNCINANFNTKNEKIIIPATEQSAGRGNDNAPHPLLDTFDYLSSRNQAKHDEYMKLLGNWIAFDNNPYLKIVYDYLMKGTILQDVESHTNLHFSSSNSKKEKNYKELVSFHIDDDSIDSEKWGNHDLHLNEKLRESWCKFYTNIVNTDEKRFPKSNCMVSGDGNTPIPLARKFGRGFAKDFNARYISANDTQSWTWKGDFIDDIFGRFACSKEISEKAGAALRWLIKVKKCYIPVSFEKSNLLLIFEAPELNEDGSLKFFPDDATVTDYVSLIKGYGGSIALKQNKNLMVVTMNIPTQGRIAIDAQEMATSEIVKHLEEWDETFTCDTVIKNKQLGLTKIGNVSSMLDALFGHEKIMRINHKSLLNRDIYQNLLEGRIFGKKNLDLLIKKCYKRILQRWSNTSYKFEKKDDYCLKDMINLLNCLYNFQQSKGKTLMGLDINCTDRSYLYGRLLACQHHIELTLAGPGNSTHAMKSVKLMANKPATTYNNVRINVQTKWLSRMGNNSENGGLIGKDKQIMNAIAEQFTPEEYANDAPLGPLFLLGFDHQLNDIYKKKEEKLNEQL